MHIICKLYAPLILGSDLWGPERLEARWLHQQGGFQQQQDMARLVIDVYIWVNGIFRDVFNIWRTLHNPSLPRVDDSDSHGITLYLPAQLRLGCAYSSH